MQLEQRFELPVPPAAAWPALRNIELLIDCLPGAALTGEAVDGELPMRFDVKLGPIAAHFTGSGRASFDDAAQTGRFEGTAVDRKTASRVRGAADFALSAGVPGTVVTVGVTFALSGALAQFSRGGIVRELANALTAQFAANLGARLNVASASVMPDTVAAAPIPAPAANAPLDGGALVWRALWNSLRNWWRGLARRGS